MKNGEISLKPTKLMHRVRLGCFLLLIHLALFEASLESLLLVCIIYSVASPLKLSRTEMEKQQVDITSGFLRNVVFLSLDGRLSVTVRFYTLVK